MGCTIKPESFYFVWRFSRRWRFSSGLLSFWPRDDDNIALVWIAMIVKLFGRKIEMIPHRYSDVLWYAYFRIRAKSIHCYFPGNFVLFRCFSFHQTAKYTENIFRIFNNTLTVDGLYTAEKLRIFENQSKTEKTFEMFWKLNCYRSTIEISACKNDCI